MDFAPEYQRFARVVVIILASAVLHWFGTGMTPWWPLMWFAPLPVLIYSLNGTWRATFVIALVAWLIGNLSLWSYLHHLQLPIGAMFGLIALPALIFALAVLLFRGLCRRRAYWTALFAFPATWVSYEYLLSISSPHGTAANLAYSQLNFLPLLQLASLTGPWGISFLLLLFPAACALSLHLRKSAPRRALSIGGTGAGLLAVALVFGAIRLTQPDSANHARVGLIASDASGNTGVADEGAPTETLLDSYAMSVDKLAKAGAKIVVLPEKLGVVVDPDTKDVDAKFQALADRHEVRILVGLVHVTPASHQKWNEARLYEPQAGIRSYYKRHMLPPFESDIAVGTRLVTISDSASLYGIAICKDLDFPQPARDYGLANIGLLLIPAWDFDMDRWWHGHMAIMRGVEYGFATARSAKQGYLTVSDNRGRVLAETQSDSAPYATLIADVPTQHSSTLYGSLGEWFAWVAILIAAWTMITMLIVRARRDR